MTVSANKRAAHTGLRPEDAAVPRKDYRRFLARLEAVEAALRAAHDPA